MKFLIEVDGCYVTKRLLGILYEVYVFRGWCKTGFSSRVKSKIGNCISVEDKEMGSEGPKAVVIHVTGFKRFQGVSQNPTETIVKNLKDFVEKRGLAAGVTLGSCTILEAAGDGALATLLKTMEAGISTSNASEQVVWVSVQYQIHCGFKNQFIILRILEMRFILQVN